MKRIIQFFLLCSFLIIGDSLLANPMDLHWRYSGTTNDLCAAAYGQSLFVVVGKSGTILTSPDTINWSSRPSGTTNDLTGVAYGDGVFVAVGGNSTAEILTSTNGISWQPQSAGTTNELKAVTYGAGRFVAVGQQGTILTSTNGISWSKRPTGLAKTLFAVCQQSGIFVTVGEGGSLLTSSDGLAWTVRNSGVLLDLYCVTSLENVSTLASFFVASGASGIAVSSGNAVDWTAVTIPADQDVYAAAVAGAFGNGSLGTFALAGANGTYLTSDNGTSWSSDSTPHVNWRGLLHVDGEFLAVGDNGSIACGLVWLPRDSMSSAGLNAATYGNGNYVAVGNGGTVLTSPDGTSWTSQLVGTQNLNSVTFGAGKFVAVGEGFSILTSSNGVGWSSTTLPDPPDFVCCTKTLQHVAYGNGMFIAAGYYSFTPPVNGPPWKAIVALSPDGINWTTTTNVPTGYLGYYLTPGAGPGVFLLAGSSIFSSADGSNWTERAATDTYLPLLQYGSNQFLAVGEFNQGYAQPLVTSTNGTNWTTTTASQSVPYQGIAYGNGEFLTVGQANSVYAFSASSDGTNWTPGVFYESGIAGVTYGANSFLAVGTNGLILQTVPEVLPPQIEISDSTNGVELLVITEPGKAVDVQTSTTLNSWSDWMAITPQNDVTPLPLATTNRTRFYRAITP